MKRIEVVDKQNSIFLLRIDNIECCLIKAALYVGNSMLPKSAVVKGSTLGWNFTAGFVSYNQLKKEIVLWQQRNAPAKRR